MGVLKFRQYDVASQKNGVIIKQSVCQPKHQIYEQFIEKQKKAYLSEFEYAQQRGVVMQSWEQLVPFLPTKEEFELKRAYVGFECKRIEYWSDGLKVIGYIWKPKNTEGRKLPLIIVNRGGSLELGKLTPRLGLRFGFYNFLSNGFVVIGSQYRGNDGGQGKEEFGGADIHDVLNLIPLAKSLEYIDTNNIFMFGASRGGMTSYLTLKQGISVNAVAVIGGLSDLEANLNTFPELLNRWQKLIPDLKKNRGSCLRDRSAVYWSDKLDSPILILHGSADWRCNLDSQALALAQKLQESQKSHQLIVYEGDDHFLSFNRENSEKRIIEWFKSHMK
ncbi:conserved hypothetical protein [Hyella patelloides LEGE 07179]|uniref:Peptidase S9 prolyl oligopeptidase catalytic domain-containing protein n=1 Tax=Hyella patelloides LEGE 07179 TaxID=945734 RepID=A0A563VVR3_9CYAN|nr:prolyl oligopeptidase family serine peptidase [Hyella patelloides]VEP15353.1 conserved hypothetical protein [Hyella patelloides LEGE 07179]